MVTADISGSSIRVLQYCDLATRTFALIRNSAYHPIPGYRPSLCPCFPKGKWLTSFARNQNTKKKPPTLGK